MRFDFILLFRMLNVNTINCHFTNDICWDLINKSSKHLTIIIFFSPQNDGNKITRTHTHKIKSIGRFIFFSAAQFSVLRKPIRKTKLLR